MTSHNVGSYFWLFLWVLFSAPLSAALPQTVKKVEPSIVGVGTYRADARPNAELLGTGFAIGDGSIIVTNAHVVPPQNRLRRQEKTLSVFVGHGNKTRVRTATVIAEDNKHDLALLKMNGPSLPPMTLSRSNQQVGESIAFTGFPLGAMGRLYPITHNGIISGISPVSIPSERTANLTSKQIALLRSPFNMYQLDALAYPGNSGSPVFDTETGEVVAVVNAVLMRRAAGKSERLIATTFTYAVPVRYLRQLAAQHTQ